jgi:phosphoglycerate dehydrogenase-like enzyme
MTIKRRILSTLLAASYFVAAGSWAVTPAVAQAQAAAQEPIPPSDANALIREYELPVSKQTVKEMRSNWRKPRAMLVSGLDRPDRLAWLQEAVPGVKLIAAPARGTGVDWAKIPGIEQVDASIFGGTNPELLKAATNLRWIHNLSAGVDGLSANPALAGNKYLITNLAKMQTQVASNAFALMVSLMRGMDKYVRMDVAQHLQEPQWDESRGMQLDSPWTLLVVGLGGIGTHVAKMAHFGLGMKIIATRVSSHEGPDWVDYVGLANELPDLVGKADIIVAAAPLTPETEGMFNTALFNRMKKGVLFVNVGRGKEVVTADLIAALKSGQVGAAGLDVTDPEPLPDRHPLWSAPNTLIITHQGPPSRAAEGDQDFVEKRWVITRENMRRYANGDRMINVVDLERGY